MDFGYAIKPIMLNHINNGFHHADKEIPIDVLDEQSLEKVEMDKEFYLDMIENCSIFDMECFALAKVCKTFDMKFSSYKWVSDDGDGSTWEENCKIGFNKLKIKLNEDISSR